MESPAQLIASLANEPALTLARKTIRARDIIDRAIAIQQIAAPTFQEEARAQEVQRRFAALGLKQVEMDALFNVYGWLPAQRPDAPVLLISAHTDTVFTADTDLTIREEGARIYGPGLGDNSLGVAALLKIAELFAQGSIHHQASLCFVANSREEGLGNLEGIRGAIDHLNGRIDAALVIEGMGLGRVYRAGIRVRRLRVDIAAPGGHSWLHFGNASAIHTLLQFGAEITRLSVPTQPRTSYNIGIIEGGRSVNSIATDASCLIDLRSEDDASLRQLEETIRALKAQHETKDVCITLTLVGDRPGGAISDDHPLVELARASHRVVNIEPEVGAGSTDANALLAAQIPTVCVGVSYGGNAHRVDEFIETQPIEDGLWQLLLLVTAASREIGTG